MHTSQDMYLPGTVSLRLSMYCHVFHLQWSLQSIAFLQRCNSVVPSPNFRECFAEFDEHPYKFFWCIAFLKQPDKCLEHHQYCFLLTTFLAILQANLPWCHPSILFHHLPAHIQLPETVPSTVCHGVVIVSHTRRPISNLQCCHYSMVLLALQRFARIPPCSMCWSMESINRSNDPLKWREE